MSRTILEISTDFFVIPITSLRERLGLTQEEMAKEVGVTLRGYVGWERGESIPSGDHLIKMMRLAPDLESLELFGLDMAGLKSREKVDDEKKEARRTVPKVELPVRPPRPRR